MRRSDWMLSQLPLAMVSEDFFARFVSIFQTVGGTLLDDADNVANIVDVSVAPTPFLPYLGSWTGVPALDPSLDDERQRAILRAWGSMLAWRGTQRGLREFLALVCEGPVTVQDSGGVLGPDDTPVNRPPQVRVEVGASRWLTSKDLAVLVRDEVPAHVFLELWVEGEQLVPPPETPTLPAGPEVHAVVEAPVLEIED